MRWQDGGLKLEWSWVKILREMHKGIEVDFLGVSLQTVIFLGMGKSLRLEAK